MSEASLPLDVDCGMVETDASRLLQAELERYCERELNGRSFLIAGHRGAGKTTLVANAFLEAFKRAERGPLPVRPLLIQLHGPDLLPWPERKPPPVPKPKEGETPKPEVPPEEMATRVVLEEITLGLHRAVAREFARSFREATRRKTTLNRVRRLEVFEMAAELEVELYDFPSAARLRDLWQRAGFLRDGVLFRPSYDERARRAMAPRPDQGLRELVALHTVTEAYRRISGEYSQTEDDKQVDNKKDEATQAVDTTGKNLLQPIVSLLTGGIVGSSLVQADISPYIATISGLVTALGTVVILKYSTTRGQDRTITRSQKFMRDLSVATLDRVLPIVIERLLQAGLAPMFVVDELDKVHDFENRAVKMVAHLKKLVAESAFFCFLTDRSYFEDVQNQISSRPFPTVHTYYSHRIFVMQSPDDLHKHLRKVLNLDGRAGPPQHPNARPIAPGSDEEQDANLIPYFLLYRSQMHPVDLQREISRRRTEKGEVDLKVGDIRSSWGLRLDPVIQAAIELVLDREVFRIRLENKLGLRRFAHDAMYYLTRTRKSDRRIDLGPAGLDSFGAYLVERAGGDPAAVNVTKLMNEEERDFLWARVRDLVGLLADRAQLKSQITTRNTERQARGLPVIPWAIGSSLDTLQSEILHQLPGEPDIYYWTYGIDGTNYAPAPPAVMAVRQSAWPDDVTFIRAVSQTIEEVTG
ncbi:MAG: hypothetical protein WEE89_15240 [Gemmatimonadota bacterium]